MASTADIKVGDVLVGKQMITGFHCTHIFAKVIRKTPKCLYVETMLVKTVRIHDKPGYKLDEPANSPNDWPAKVRIFTSNMNMTASGIKMTMELWDGVPRESFDLHL